MQSNHALMPVVFISHGPGPWHVMNWDPPDQWDGLKRFLGAIHTMLPDKPAGILMISAHWEERVFTLQTSPEPPMIYDYSGFPQEAYQLKYSAPGRPELAERASNLLKSVGLPTEFDSTRGFDHGMFVPMMFMYPNADVPVVQLSIHRTFDPALHLAAGAALAPLRKKRVLIVASGLSYHNFRGFGGPPDAPAHSAAFDRRRSMGLV